MAKFNFPADQAQMLQWAGEASVIVGDIFDAVSKCFTEEVFPDRLEGTTLWQLQASTHATGESVLLLVGNVRLWDADVLVRSVVEGSFKFVFLLIGDERERARKMDEFANVLFEISELKRNSRLVDFLQAIPNPEADEWIPFRQLLLTPARIDEIKAKYSRDARRIVEQRWSFGEICAALKRSGLPGINNLGHMMYSYGMSSHIAHQDAVGIGMVWDRNGRNDVRREAVEMAHATRLVSDVCMMSWLRAQVLFKRSKADVIPLNPLAKRIDELCAKMAPATKNFNSVEFGI